MLSKLKYSKHCWYMQYILLLSGDINLHPGPVQYPCLVCSKAVRKRVFCCNKCGLWVHKKYYIPSKNIGNGSSFICKPCENNANISYDNIWHQFPIADDYFSDDKTVPCEKQNKKLTPILTNLATLIATLITGKFSIKEAYTLST